ncbi:MAG TPA: hypothetical protein PK397_01595 [Ignavibacteriaceae bacterium]|nr:hypothetical protein [Ignavibacteriaceae bacterium]
MKTRIFVVLVLFLSINLLAQNDTKNHLISIGDINLNGYLALNGKYTSYESNGAGFLDFRAAIVFDNGWAVGFDASGLYYDKKLNALVKDGTYHVEAGYAGFYIEKIFSVTENLKVSISLLMASGLAKYRYDKEYREQKVWYQEIIDQTNFFVTEPTVEIQQRIAGNWWIGLNGSYRNTSPIKMIQTDENMLKKFNAGLTFKYGIF